MHRKHKRIIERTEVTHIEVMLEKLWPALTAENDEESVQVQILTANIAEIANRIGRHGRQNQVTFRNCLLFILSLRNVNNSI